MEKFGDKLAIKLGAELGEANLAFDRAEILLNSAEKLDFCIGSVHTCSEKFNCLDLYFLEEGQSPDYYRAVIEDYLDCVLAISRWGRSTRSTTRSTSLSRRTSVILLCRS